MRLNLPNLSLTDLVDTIVIVMMENRSFDHILGHLSYEDEVNWPTLEGLRKSEVQNYRNHCIYNNEPYYPNPVSDGYFPNDLPHERDCVARQLSRSNGVCNMTGFTNAYYEYCHHCIRLDPNCIEPFEPIGFLGSKDLPVTSFLANNFAVCDHWFAPLPASTHPNRIMALSGSTPIDRTTWTDITLEIDSIVLDWLDARGIRWRVYHDGLFSFFFLLRRLDFLNQFFDDEKFRSFERFEMDMAKLPSENDPNVIFIEPSYNDAPYSGDSLPNDNHPPLPVSFGEQFLKRVYQGITANSSRWKKTVTVITYDEHGGFFDHVSPLPIPYVFPGIRHNPFETTGIRVPAIIVSPLVQPRTVYPGFMDHTSILQFLAQRFDHDRNQYSDNVNNRRSYGIESVSGVLRLTTSPQPDIPNISNINVAQEPYRFRGSSPKTEMQRAIERVGVEMISNYPSEVRGKFPKLWKLYNY